MNHPDDEQLQAYLAGSSGSASFEAIDNHLVSCEQCVHRIGQLEPTQDDLVSMLKQIAPASTLHVPNSDFAELLPTTERYEVQDVIARGGMGEIYHALDRHLNRQCALKVLLECRTKDNALARFFREAKIMACLQHPGIPPIYDVGKLPDGRPFIAMKLIEGRTFKELLDEKKSIVNRDSHLSVFQSVCQTMAYVHAEGFIHCDLKPDNIMVGPFGEVQVMDWGLARRTLDAPGSVDEREWFVGELIRQSAVTYGTPGYMSPEQKDGDFLKVRQSSDTGSENLTNAK